jgi:hypothetical protein
MKEGRRKRGNVRVNKKEEEKEEEERNRERYMGLNTDLIMIMGYVLPYTWNNWQCVKAERARKCKRV